MKPRVLTVLGATGTIGVTLYKGSVNFASASDVPRPSHGN